MAWHWLSLARLIAFKKATARGAESSVNVRLVMLLHIIEELHHESRRKPKTVYDLGLCWHCVVGSAECRAAGSKMYKSTVKLVLTSRR